MENLQDKFRQIYYEKYLKLVYKGPKLKGVPLTEKKTYRDY
jgi:hypothetical protein